MGSLTWMHRCSGAMPFMVIEIAKRLLSEEKSILDANEKDLNNAKINGMSIPMQDRLMLNHDRLTSISDSIKKIADLEDPIGKCESFTRPNGLLINRVKVPLGVIGIIYEARPNVTPDAASLCLKSGNAVVLRGGKEAICTNIRIVNVIGNCLKDLGIDENAVSLIEDTSRDSSTALMNMKGLVDVLIPRG